jgi:hypothetical protein
MDELDELMSEVKVLDTVNAENNTSSSDKRKKWWRDVKKNTDWAKVPLHLLIGAILLIGAYLMGTSVLLMTGNLFVAILSPAFTELGLTAAHLASERPKNSIRQTEISRKLRNWHIFTTVILLMANLVIETAKALLNIKIDGVVYVVFGIIGLTSLLDIVAYFKFQDHDDELTAKNSHAKKMEGIKNSTLSNKMKAFEDAEKIKSEEMVKFWKENAPELARYKARLESAKEIKKVYADLGMTPDEAKKLLADVGFAEGEVVEEEGGEDSKRKYNKTGKYKKPQLPPPTPKPIGENQTLEEKAKLLENQFVEED